MEGRGTVLTVETTTLESRGLVWMHACMQATNGTIDPIAPASPLACNARLEGKILREKGKLLRGWKAER
jgi:hypothetical protein